MNYKNVGSGKYSVGFSSEIPRGILEMPSGFTSKYRRVISPHICMVLFFREMAVLFLRCSKSFSMVEQRMVAKCIVVQRFVTYSIVNKKQRALKSTVPAA